jgi:hypothetical protein
MRTVFASLPFYDSLVKQDRVRENAVIPIHCPRTQLPPFEIAVGSATVATINTIKLVACDGTKTTINGFFTAFPTVTASVSTTLGPYIQYNGTALSSSLPVGSYYVEIVKSDATYYSDWINVRTMANPLEKFIKIEFSDANNLGDLRYENGFKQQVWLEAVLNNPTHEMVNIGEEKDGVFVAEKVVSKKIYSIIAYVSRSLYECLMRLPQHSTITITDETGQTYTPAVGNITVEPGEWNFYDICKIKINFNDGANSSFGWTK